MQLAHPQIRQQTNQRLRTHRRSPLGVQRQLFFHDSLPLAGLFHQEGRQVRAFPISDHPFHHAAAENIQDNVQVIVRQFHRPRSFVISHDQTWLGAFAASRSVANGGWMAWFLRPSLPRRESDISSVPSTNTYFHPTTRRRLRWAADQGIAPSSAPPTSRAAPPPTGVAARGSTAFWLRRMRHTPALIRHPRNIHVRTGLDNSYSHR
jgi:hypothetical protein